VHHPPQQFRRRKMKVVAGQGRPLPQCQWAEYAPDGDGDCDSFGYFRCENCGTVLAAGNGRRCPNCGASNTPD